MSNSTRSSSFGESWRRANGIDPFAPAACCREDLAEQWQPAVKSADAMAAFTTILYKDWTGVEVRWNWRTKAHFPAARRFLEQLLGGPASPVDKADFFLIENEQQYDALLAFRRKLERGDD
jgi:hypothetical protein